VEGDMMNWNFNVTGQERRALVEAISEILNTPATYLKIPTYAYQIGGFHVSKTGLVTGEYDLNLFVGLAERGFEPEPSKTFHFTTPRGTLLVQEIFPTAEEAQTAGYGMYFTHNDHDVYIKPSGTGEHCKHFALVGEPFPKAEPEEATEPEEPAEPETPIDRVCIEIPLDGLISTA